jgi:hypothetical protein
MDIKWYDGQAWQDFDTRDLLGRSPAEYAPFKTGVPVICKLDTGEYLVNTDKLLRDYQQKGARVSRI